MDNTLRKTDPKQVKILRVQSEIDPRSYKIARALAPREDVEFVRCAYSNAILSAFYSSYRDNLPTVGPALFRSTHAGSLNSLIDIAYLRIWPYKKLLIRRIQRVAEKHHSQIIHTGSPIDALGVLCKTGCGLPVVHEIYDTYSLYDSPIRRKSLNPLRNNPFRIALSESTRKWRLEDERRVHQECDALIFTSDEMRSQSEEMYGEFVSEVIPNGVLKEHLPARRRERLSKIDGLIHCVYLGVVSSAIRHRDILELFIKLLSHKEIVLHIYPVLMSDGESHALKKKLAPCRNVVIHTPLPYSQLYDEITRYDIGLVMLSPHDERLLDCALPNKIFEYVACGLYVAVPPYESLVNFVRKYNCGTVVEDWEADFVSNLGRLPEIPFRDEFTIDFYMPQLIKLFKRFV